MILKFKIALFRFFAPKLARMFFEPKYLSGRWFEGSGIGYGWCMHAIWTQKFLRLNRYAPVPIAPSSRVSNWDNLKFHPDNIDNFQSTGCYFQNFAGSIELGRGTYIASNVGIITTNHNPANLDEHLDAKDVVIGENCWIGMNSVILPGVHLGNNTVVAAGSVVTKSFSRGKCVVAGAPAKVIRDLAGEINESY